MSTDRARESGNAGLSPEEIAEDDRRYVLTPWQRGTDRRPLAVAGAKGCYFWDSAGKRYLDFTSGFVFANIGYGEERVVAAIADQARSLATIASPFASAPKSRLAKMLAEVTPGDLGKTFFCTSGAEANEAAIKLVRAITGREKIVSRYNSYHGSTYGAMALSRDPRSWPFEPSIPNVVYALPCYPYRCRLCTGRGGCTGACVEHIEDILRYSGGADQVAGVIVEPVTGSNGVVVPPDGYMERLRALCDKYRVLLIADEVMTGFGRTGKWFAVEHWGVVPDVITVAKGITSGYVPLAAAIVRESPAAHFEEHPWMHGHTYSGHPLACAAGVATLEVYREDGLVERAAEMGAYLMEGARALQGRHPSIGEVRGLGLFVGIELVRDRTTREPLIDSTDPAGAALKRTILARLMDEGVYMLPSQVSALILAPPLIITRDEIDWALAALDDALALADEAARAG
jgi:taurine--2-oxoglutarate transaminase